MHGHHYDPYKNQHLFYYHNEVNQNITNNINIKSHANYYFSGEN